MEANSSSSLSSTKAHKINNNNNNNRYTKIELTRSDADVDADADAPANERTIIMLDTEMLTTGFDPLEGNEDYNNAAAATTTTTRPSGSSSKELSRFDAMQHLIKGNLGPGCLNIPHAFALSGWVLGTGLFFLVAIQGIYSMVVLVYCKQWIVQHLKREQQEEEEERPPSQHEQKPVRTFMDVAHFTHGRLGAISVQILLFVLQAGVCCVFLSLIATNLHASLPHWDAQWCLCVVTLALLVVVLLKDLKELKWLSVGANCLMVVAILTASVTALWTLEQDNDENKNPSLKWTKNPAAIATFVSSMFYSFEGIGLVMPVENSFVGKTEEEEESSLSTALAREEEQRKKVASFVNPVLIGAMSIVGGLFLLIGTTCGPAFPNIHDGSVTAYLTMQFPDNRWYQIVNASVMVAVFLTFPLQLTPAMEVLEEWFGPGCDPLCCGGSQSHAMIIAQQDPRDEFLDEPPVESSTTVDPIRSMSLHTNACFGKHEWIFRRYMVVLGCAVVVLSVNDLGLLMSLFGALGNTGLAALPCVIHWRLMQLEIAPLSFGLMAMDLLTMMMSLSVAGAGVVFSVQEILAKNETD